MDSFIRFGTKVVLFSTESTRWSIKSISCNVRVLWNMESCTTLLPTQSCSSTQAEQTLDDLAQSDEF